MKKTRCIAFLAAVLLACFSASSCDALAVMPQSPPPTAAPTSAALPAETLSTAPMASEPAEATPAPESTEAAPVAVPVSTPSPEPTPIPTSAFSETSFVFAGDLIFNKAFVQSAKDGAQYDFSSAFQGIAPDLGQADFAVANLESPVWDPAQSKYGDVRFAAPPEAVPQLGEAGFDVLTTANDHAMDQGAAGLSGTIDAILGAGMKTTGTWRNADEQQQICMLEHGGMKIALLAYGRAPRMYGKFDPGMGTNLLDEDAMRADIERAKQAGADAVILCLHFGNELAAKPTAAQKRLVDDMRDAGATAVIGAHSHILQPLVVDAGGGFAAAYSLGSLATTSSVSDRQFSALLNLTLRKDSATGAVTVAAISYIPTWSRMLQDANGTPKLRIYDLRHAIAACEAGSDPLIPQKYLGELTKGLGFVENARRGIPRSAWINNCEGTRHEKGSPVLRDSGPLPVRAAGAGMRPARRRASGGRHGSPVLGDTGPTGLNRGGCAIVSA